MVIKGSEGTKVCEVGSVLMMEAFVGQKQDIKMDGWQVSRGGFGGRG